MDIHIIRCFAYLFQDGIKLSQAGSLPGSLGFQRCKRLSSVPDEGNHIIMMFLKLLMRGIPRPRVSALPLGKIIIKADQQIEAPGVLQLCRIGPPDHFLGIGAIRNFQGDLEAGVAPYLVIDYAGWLLSCQYKMDSK